MPLQMSGLRLYPLTTFTPLGCLFLSFQAEVIFIRRFLDCPYWSPFLCFQAPCVAAGRTSITVVDPCLDPGSKGLVRVLLCIPRVRADLR